MPGGHFHMGRKSKYSADFKLMIIHEAETSGIREVFLIRPYHQNLEAQL